LRAADGAGGRKLRPGQDLRLKEETMTANYNVLFLCTGNSCRSILAEAIMNRRGAGRFRAFSAGSMPTGQVNPHALDLLQRMGHDTRGLRSKSWEEFSRRNPAASELDFVFTVCDDAAGEVCPIWPGQPMTAHWGMPDPARATGTEAEIGVAFADTYRMLDNRIGLFVNLPMASLDRLALQKRLDDIGHDTAGAAAQ
jgi:arsenate reductase